MLNARKKYRASVYGKGVILVYIDLKELGDQIFKKHLYWRISSLMLKRERKGEGEREGEGRKVRVGGRERETLMIGYLPYLPQPGIEPTTPNLVYGTTF